MNWACSMGHHLELDFLDENDWPVKGHDIVGHSINGDGVSMPLYNNTTAFGFGIPRRSLLDGLWKSSDKEAKKDKNQLIFSHLDVDDIGVAETALQDSRPANGDSPGSTQLAIH